MNKFKMGDMAWVNNAVYSMSDERVEKDMEKFDQPFRLRPC